MRRRDAFLFDDSRRNCGIGIACEDDTLTGRKQIRKDGDKQAAGL